MTRAHASSVSAALRNGGMRPVPSALRGRRDGVAVSGARGDRRVRVEATDLGDAENQAALLARAEEILTGRGYRVDSRTESAFYVCRHEAADQTRREEHGMSTELPEWITKDLAPEPTELLRAYLEGESGEATRLSETEVKCLRYVLGRFAYGATGVGHNVDTVADVLRWLIDAGGRTKYIAALYSAAEEDLTRRRHEDAAIGQFLKRVLPASPPAPQQDEDANRRAMARHMIRVLARVEADGGEPTDELDAAVSVYAAMTGQSTHAACEEAGIPTGRFVVGGSPDQELRVQQPGHTIVGPRKP